jgi:hypothetical protein
MNLVPFRILFSLKYKTFSYLIKKGLANGFDDAIELDADLLDEQEPAEEVVTRNHAMMDTVLDWYFVNTIVLDTGCTCTNRTFELLFCELNHFISFSNDIPSEHAHIFNRTCEV